LTDWLQAAETEEDREYQRFLSSLLPNEQENLSFLDEEDEEYRPDEEEDDHEDEDARRGISKKELTDLLLDSTHMTFPKLPAAQPNRDELMVDKTVGATVSAAVAPASTVAATATTQPAAMKLTGNLPPSAIPAMFRGRPGAVTQAQCIQLASQMHKHLQLLLQSYHLLAARPPSPELAECRAMIEELQQRGEKALKYKNALLSKLNPAGTVAPADISGGSAQAEGSDNAPGAADKAPSASDPAAVDEGNRGSASTTNNLVALRRVTRSLTAAHAAVAHPSMFELVGSQTVDELSAGFARGCTLEERDRAIQEQMLQLDTHLVRPKKRRKSKRGYSPTEDNLLAHGVKRFGTQTSSWEQIQRHFLPSKTTQNLRYRYKYLISEKTGMSTVKALHLKAPQQHRSSSTGWLLEEDLRIARGLVKLHKEKYHFARLAKSYLPHRSRFEVRKRWERIAAKFRAELAEIGLEAPEDDSLDLAVAMKEYLEDKLRHRMLHQRGEAEKAKLDAALQLHQLGQGVRGAAVAQSLGGSTPSSGDTAPDAAAQGSGAQRRGADATCRTKNLHPALFFSSWSFISPATLLNSTCKHNWPSFMDEGGDAKDKLQRNQLNADVTRNGEAQSGPQLVDVGDSALDATMEEFMPIAMPSDLAGTLPSEMGSARIGQASLLMESRMAQKESEEEDDSDYEHDELLSSEENEESDSEFEQLELTDDGGEADADGDDEASADTVEHESFLSDSDDESVLSAKSLRTPSQSPQSSPSHVVSSSKASSDASIPSPRSRHPLRLRNLGQPGNERMKRALAALERRIVGKRVNGSASSSAAGSLTSVTKRAKRKVVSTLVAPLGAGRSAGPFQVEDDGRSLAATATTGSDADDDDWDDGSGDEEFEVDELPSSSEEFASASSDEDSSSAKPAASAPRHEAPAVPFNPNKKAKLQQCPTCGHISCTCSSSERMKLLLRRMKEKRSSSSLQ
jgi:hypothetical protein